jgi:carboxylesterase
VHGFTATPHEMRPLGEGLAAAGFSVHAVRLAGHGTHVEDLAATSWTDWFASVEAGLAALRAERGRVAVCGMSLGALLALHLAAARPAEVDALVLCGTPVLLGDARVRWLPTLARVPWLARRWATIPKGRGPDISDPAARDASLSYRAMPLAAIVQLLRFQAIVRSELARVAQPALLVHGRDDHSVPVANLDVLRQRLASPWVEAHVLERSWHVVTLDVERHEVVRLATDFLGRVESGAP